VGMEKMERMRKKKKRRRISKRKRGSTKRRRKNKNKLWRNYPFQISQMNKTLLLRSFENLIFLIAW